MTFIIWLAHDHVLVIRVVPSFQPWRDPGDLQHKLLCRAGNYPLSGNTLQPGADRGPPLPAIR